MTYRIYIYIYYIYILLLQPCLVGRGQSLTTRTCVAGVNRKPGPIAGALSELGGGGWEGGGLAGHCSEKGLFVHDVLMAGHLQLEFRQ